MSQESHSKDSTIDKRSILQEIKKVTRNMADIASSMDHLDDQEKLDQLRERRRCLRALLSMREFIVCGNDMQRSEYCLQSDLEEAQLDASEFPEFETALGTQIDEICAQLEKADEPYADGVWLWGDEEGNNNKAADFMKLFDSVGPITTEKLAAKLKDLNLSKYKRTMLVGHRTKIIDVDTLSQKLDLERDEAISLYFGYHLKTPYQEGEEYEGPANVDFLYSESSERDREVMDKSYKEAFYLLLEQGFVNQAAELAISYLLLAPEKAKDMLPEEDRGQFKTYITEWLEEREGFSEQAQNEDDLESVASFRTDIELVKSFFSL